MKKEFKMQEQILLKKWKELISENINTYNGHNYIDGECIYSITLNNIEILSIDFKENIYLWLWNKYQINCQYVKYNNSINNFHYFSLQRISRPNTKFSQSWSKENIEENLRKWEEIQKVITKDSYEDLCIHCDCERQLQIILETNQKLIEAGWKEVDYCTYCCGGFYSPWMKCQTCKGHGWVSDGMRVYNCEDCGWTGRYYRLEHGDVMKKITKRLEEKTKNDKLDQNDNEVVQNKKENDTLTLLDDFVGNTDPISESEIEVEFVIDDEEDINNFDPEEVELVNFLVENEEKFKEKVDQNKEFDKIIDQAEEELGKRVFSGKEYDKLFKKYNILKKFIEKLPYSIEEMLEELNGE